jgi:phosphate uptake regulator
MQLLKETEQNFKLLLLEVIKQLEDTQRTLMSPSKQLVEKVRTRDDYIDAMKNIIENKNISYVAGCEKIDKKTLHIMWAVNTIAHNLEHIADLAVNMADQSMFLTDTDFMKKYDCNSYFTVILEAVGIIYKALFSGNINLALKICKTEYKLDAMYANEIRHIINEMRFSRDAGNLITAVFVFQCAERIGDSILNIGEAVISSVMGEKMKIHQFQALEDSLSTEEEKQRISEFTLESAGETRSGSTIRKVYEPGNDPAASKCVVFKEGKTAKLSGEKENIEKWEKIMPGLPPKIFGFQVNGKNASIILEYLNGKNMKDVVINEKPAYIKEAHSLIFTTLENLWSSTKRKKPARAAYLEQLTSRLDDVYKAHPDFALEGKSIGRVELPSLEEMLKRGFSIEKKLEAPFSVFMHGDFNIDNIIYNARERRINFIDLHRSAYGDYVQDVSVYIISNFRMPFFDANIRKKLNGVIIEFYNFASAFARKNNDKTFEARLAFGLARSFLTSTRFEFNSDFAKVMYLRAMYLMEKIITHDEKAWEDFRIHEDIFIY